MDHLLETACGSRLLINSIPEILTKQAAFGMLCLQNDLVRQLSSMYIKRRQEI